MLKNQRKDTYEDVASLRAAVVAGLKQLGEQFVEARQRLRVELP